MLMTLRMVGSSRRALVDDADAAGSASLTSRLA